MKLTSIHIGFIGFGHMAQVIFRALDHSKLIPHSQISFIQRDSKKMKENERIFRITSTTLETLVHKSDLIFLCVRPDQAASVMKDLAQIGVDGKLIISILAGVKIAFFQKHLGEKAQFLRVMPNLPAAVGEGMTLFSYGPNPSVQFKSYANLLFGCMGRVSELEERFMDIGCGLSGSGPGFVFRLIESAARLGEKEGLTYSDALTIVAQTFLGAASLILKGNVSPVDLITQIATRGGTTEAGFDKMSELHLEKSFQSVIQASANRSKTLSENFQDPL